MRSERPDVFSDPLPSTGHPLAFVAQVAITLNGLAFGAVVGMFLGACIAYEIVPRLLGRQLSDPTGLTITMAFLAIGAVGGLWIAGWVIHRLSAKGVSVVLIALGFVPVIGIAFHIGQALAEVWMRLRPVRSTKSLSNGIDDCEASSGIDGDFDDDVASDESDWDRSGEANR
jgi:hypothetical protein